MTRNSPFNWLISKIQESDYIREMNIVSENLLCITRTDRPTINVTYTNLKKITIEDVQRIIKYLGASPRGIM